LGPVQVSFWTFRNLKIVLAAQQEACQSDFKMKIERKINQGGKRFVCYLRVSKVRQGESGLGLEAQRKAVADFVRHGGGEIAAEFVEVESGKRADRPQLGEAIARCKRDGLTLLVAKLDRLARNVHFISTLQHAKVDFLAVDNPHATQFLVHILAAVAEHEATMISNRTKSALAAFKARGGTLGNPRYVEALPKANAARSERAKERNGGLLATVNEIKAKTGLIKLRELAEALNLRGIKTARGNAWTASHVFNLTNTPTA
jgi:DNA invertase Pin-like site-specific DNA recombinase